MFLVKGNMPGNSFQQSLNEVFASSLHRKQKFDNHVEYKLIKLKGRYYWLYIAMFHKR